MTSKNLYFKLMREDWKSRLWAAALIGLGCFFLFPVTAAFMAGTIRDYTVYETGLRNYQKEMLVWLSFKNGGTAAAMMIAALICALSGFSWLNSRSKVDFYHSIPVRREKLYVVNYLDGILILAVPYAASLIAAVIIGIANGVEGKLLWQVALEGWALHMIYFILMYSTVVIAVMLTGNLVVAILGSMVLTFYAPLASMLLNGYASSFFDTYLYRGIAILPWMTRISPVTEYVRQIGNYANNEKILPAVLAALAVSPVLAVLGGWLYRKRPSEAAGKAMAFAVTKPVIRILITLMASLGGGLFFWELREAMGWAVFGVVCGAVISHCVIEIIYHFDFKKLFSGKGQLGGCILASLAFFCVFRYDLTGYDRYLPESGQVKEAVIVAEQLNDWVSYGHTERREDGSYQWRWDSGEEYVMEHMKDQDIENLLSIAAEGVKQTAERKKENQKNRIVAERTVIIGNDAKTEEAEPEQSGETDSLARNDTMAFVPMFRDYHYVTFRYTLNSGRQVFRRYYMSLQPVSSQAEKLYQDAAYQKGTFPLLARTSDQVASIRYREKGREARIDGLTEQEKKAFLETYQQEFASMPLRRMKEECPVGLIRFTLNEDEAAMKWRRESFLEREDEYDAYHSANEFSTRDFYPVYPSFTKTLDLLKKNGAQPDRAWDLDGLIAVKVSGYKRDGSAFTLPLTDSEEIGALLETSVEGGMFYYNPLFQVDAVSLELTYGREKKADYSSMFDVYFPAGKIPAVLQEKIKEAFPESGVFAE